MSFKEDSGLFKTIYSKFLITKNQIAVKCEKSTKKVPILRIVFNRQILFRILSVVLYNDNMLEFLFFKLILKTKTYSLINLHMWITYKYMFFHTMCLLMCYLVCYVQFYLRNFVLCYCDRRNVMCRKTQPFL